MITAYDRALQFQDHAFIKYYPVCQYKYSDKVTITNRREPAMRTSRQQAPVMRYFIYLVVALILAGFCYYAFTDVHIQQETVTKRIPNEHFHQ